MAQTKPQPQEINKLLDRVTSQLDQYQYSKVYKQVMLRIIKRMREYAADQNLTMYSTMVGESFAEWLFQTEEKTTYQINANRMLEMINQTYLHGVFEKPYRARAMVWPETLADIFEAYCKERERVLGTASALAMRHRMYNFAVFLSARDITSMDAIAAEDLQAFILTLSGFGYSATRARMSELKQFCVFLEENGLNQSHLSSVLPKVRYTERPRIPTFFALADAEKLLNAVDRTSSVGKRDYAVLLLAIKTGLRTVDISALEFKNLRWDKNTIEISQHKTGNPLILPMLNDVGCALIDYIKNGRPQTESPLVFVSHKPPYNAKMISMAHMVKQYMGIAKIPIKNGRAYGLHTLRRSLASIMLENNTPYPVIAATMGHVMSSDATKRYLSIDMKQLRQCALQVPEYE